MPDYTPGKAPYTRTKPRCWTNEGFIPFRLEVLTPVFIGSGEDFSPLEYVIRKEQDGYALHLVDTKAWLLESRGKRDIDSALEGGDILGLRRLIQDQLDTARFSLVRIPFSQPAIAENLLAHIKNPQSRSKAELQLFIRVPSTLAAYIPGSSLKGAISTPLIDKLDQGNLKRNYAKAMETMFGTITNHAMQALKVSDIPLTFISTQIVSAVEVRLNPNKKERSNLPCEVVAPSTDLPLYGRLFMESSGGESFITLPDGKKITLEDLSSFCYNFYMSRFQNEFSKFYQLTHLSSLGKLLAPLKKRIHELDPTQDILLRVGHYSHIECMTVTQNAPIAKKGFGNTRTLADRKFPFGWVILHKCSKEEYQEGIVKIEETLRVVRDKHEQERRTREEEVRRVREEERKRIEAAAQAKAKAEEEQKRREEKEAKLAALSPEERAIALVDAPEATEEQSMALFSKLNSLNDDLKLKAAKALRTCWKRLGKWDGKLSKKQKEKVTAVKLLLGE